jgi:hypothetical protein
MILVLVGCFVFAPANQARAQEEEAWVAVANITGGCVISGIGALLNDNSFFKSCANGVLGGAIIYGGMKLTAEIHEFPAAGKIVQSAGVSVWENQIEGRRAFEEYRLFVGPFDLRYNFAQGNFGARLLPTTTVKIIIAFARGEEFQVKQSLLSLTPIFHTYRSRDDGGWWGGLSGFGVVHINMARHLSYRIGLTPRYYEENLSHELLHTYQYRRWGVTGSLFNKGTEVLFNWKPEESLRISFWQDFSHWSFMRFMTSTSNENPEANLIEAEIFAFWR